MHLRLSYSARHMFAFLILFPSAVSSVEAPTTTVAVEKKEYIYETKEEAKQAFKELLKEKVSTFGETSPHLS